MQNQMVHVVLFRALSSYFTPQGIKATQAYVELAKDHKLDLLKWFSFVNRQCCR